MRSHPNPARATIVWLLALVLTAVATVIQADPLPDADDDGVADALDACPGSEPGDVAGPDGCALCSCDGRAEGDGWSSRAEYLACVRARARAWRADGVVDGATARRLVRRARQATCGDAALIRCCIFQPFDAAVGRCRLMTEDACEALDERLFDRDGEADVEDAGSCLPNPCVF